MFSKKSEQPTTRLRELRGSDFTLAKGEPDIRGWDVRDAQGRKFGTVQDLIFDIRANKVRYLVLNILDTKELELEKRTVMVPIGLAELDPSDNDVLLPTVNPFQLRALPRYDKSNLGAKAERDISIVFGRQALGDTTPTPGNDVDEHFYNHEHFNQDNLYRRRRGHGQGPLTHHADDDYLRREAERGTQHSIPVRDDRLHNNAYNDPDYRAETDEEYFRRTGRRRHDL